MNSPIPQAGPSGGPLWTPTGRSGRDARRVDALADQDIPLEATIGAIDDAGVRTGDDVDFHRGI
jgi:hypothetical protein